MKLEEFPSCCTTSVVIGLGRSSNMDHDAQMASNRHPDLESKVRYLHGTMHLLVSKGMLTAITTHHQKDSIKAFKALGWRCGPWAKSRAHPNTRTKLWYWLVQDGVPDLGNTLKKLGLDK